MEKKMTKREMFAQVIALAKGEKISVLTDDIVAFAEREIQLLENKAQSKSKKDLEAEKENEKVMDLIVDVLRQSATPMTVSELLKANEEIGAYSNQKISALMRKLVEAERVTKATDKRKSVFSV